MKAVGRSDGPWASGRRSWPWPLLGVVRASSRELDGRRRRRGGRIVPGQADGDARPTQPPTATSASTGGTAVDDAGGDASTTTASGDATTTTADRSTSRTTADDDDIRRRRPTTATARRRRPCRRTTTVARRTLRDAAGRQPGAGHRHRSTPTRSRSQAPCPTRRPRTGCRCSPSPTPSRARPTRSTTSSTINPAVPRNVGVRVVELTSARFPDGSTEVLPPHAAELDRIVTIMNALPNTSALIIGHADQRGDTLTNYASPRQRALAVKNYVASHGDRTRAGCRHVPSARPTCSRSTTTPPRWR